MNNFYQKFNCSCNNCKNEKKLYLSLDFEDFAAETQINIWDFRNKETKNLFLYLDFAELKKLNSFINYIIEQSKKQPINNLTVQNYTGFINEKELFKFIEQKKYTFWQKLKLLKFKSFCTIGDILKILDV